MGRSPKTVISRRADGQKGLFVTASAEKDEILITYDGPILSHATRYSLQVDDDKHIEGTEDTNAYLNHTCEPNAYVDWSGVYLRALRPIAAGEEITFDYNMGDYELHEKFTCHCGSPRCYGEVKGFKYLTREQKLRLKPYLAPYLRKRFEAELAERI